MFFKKKEKKNLKREHRRKKAGEKRSKEKKKSNKYEITFRRVVPRDSPLPFFFNFKFLNNLYIYFVFLLSYIRVPPISYLLISQPNHFFSLFLSLSLSSPLFLSLKKLQTSSSSSFER